MIDEQLNRRRLLVGTGGVSMVALAGCVGGDDEDGNGDEESDDAAAGDDDEDAEASDDVGENGDDSDSDDADDEDDGEFPPELPDDPGEDDFVDLTGEDEVEVITREGVGNEPDFLFVEPFIRVDQGTTIRWVNEDGVFHTVTSTDSLDSRSGGGNEFNATISAEGDTFEWVAEETGQQDYYCSPHAGFMFGAIDVV